MDINFESFLNRKRGKPDFYVGYTAFTDRLIRKVFNNNAGIALFIIKAMLCNIFLFAYVTYYIMYLI